MSDHSSCQQWVSTMSALAKEKKWDQLLPLSCDNCPYQRNMRVYAPLGPIMLEPVFTHDMKEAIHRLYGPITPQEWFHIMDCHGTSESLLRELHQTGVLKDQPELADYLLASVYDDRDFCHFLLNEIGLNINLPTSDGSPLLLSYLREQIPEDEEDEKWADGVWLEEHLDGVQFILQHGADPLLADKEGLTALSFVEGLETYPALQTRLLALLQQHV